ncbi:MAG: hypothetical protein AAFX06_23875 [Planctomycetota bacterium]
MRDLENPHWIVAKGILFLLLGTLAGAILLLSAPQFSIAILLLLTVWSFCRFYYFAFYVIEHYVDSRYRYAGLTSFIVYLVRQDWRKQADSQCELSPTAKHPGRDQST